MLIAIYKASATVGYVKVTSSDNIVSWAKISLEYKYNGNEYKALSNAIDKGTEGAVDLDNVWSESGGTGKQYKIIEIDYSAFQSCSKITSITCSSTSFTTIHSCAFASCKSLKTVMIPFVQEVESQAFWYCQALTSVTFEGFLLTSVISTLYKIEDNAFEYCTSLSTFDFPSRLRVLGNNVFSHCPQLSSITINENNDYFTFEDGTLFSKDKTILYKCLQAYNKVSYEIPSSVTTIRNEAFQGCSSLASIAINRETPVNITSTTFTKAKEMTLYVPNNSIELYRNAEGWKDFKEIKDINGPKIIEFADSYVKALCVSNWDTDSDGELSEEEAAAVTSIGGVFSGKDITSFNELKYFTGITSISGFRKCSKLESIVIPEGVTSILTEAFEFCSNLKTLSLPNSLKSISKQAFKDCKSLSYLSIPNNVTFIGDKAFYNCSSLYSFSFAVGN